MPDAASEFIAEGVRAQRLGALERALEAYQAAASATADPEQLAEAITRQADVHRIRCDFDSALASARKAQEIARTAECPQQRLAEAVVSEVNTLICIGDFDTAIPKLDALVAGSTDPRVRGIALQNLGSIRAQSGQLGAAERAFSESLGNFHKAGYARGEAIALNNLGRLALDSNDPARAGPLLERALTLAHEVEDSELAALASLNLAWALSSKGELERSQDLAMAALGYFSDCNNRYREIECLRLIGDINERCQNDADAARCYERALRLAEQIRSEPEIKATREKIASLARR
jgi:tetratricopeptide (TPR) repeat protein